MDSVGTSASASKDDSREKDGGGGSKGGDPGGKRPKGKKVRLVVGAHLSHMSP